LYVALVTSLHSCIVHPCHMVPHCPLLQCPPLPHRADLSTPANSTPATWCRIVHSCIFHTPIFDRAALSTPANSINPTELTRLPSVHVTQIGLHYPRRVRTNNSALTPLYSRGVKYTTLTFPHWTPNPQKRRHRTPKN